MEKQFITINNHADLIRDVTSRGVINNNSGALSIAKAQKQYVTDMRQRLSTTEQIVNDLQKQMREVQEALRK